METRMALRVTQRTVLIIAIIAFMTTMVRTESGVSSDVPDGFVYTDLHRTVHKGDSVVLTCRFSGTPLAVYWKKGDDPRRAPNLVSWKATDDVTGLCEGERPCQIMEMNENHSLVIKEVDIAEQGLYICRVESYKGLLINNFTDISVLSPPMEPFPAINECQIISPKNTKTTCTISASQPVEISCTASGYFPDIDLYFLHGSTSLHTKDTTEVTNPDRTKNKTIYAIATASEISYVCFASNIPGLQEQRITTVLVKLPETPSPMPTGPMNPIGKTNGSEIKVVVPIIVIVILAVICTSILLLRRRIPHCGQDTLGSGTSAQFVPQSSTGDLEKTPTLIPQPAANIAESEVGFGAWKKDMRSGQKEETENVKAATEELRQEFIPINEQGAKYGKEYDKAPEEEASINKNGTDGEQISIDDGNSDDSSENPLVDTAELDHWGETHWQQSAHGPHGDVDISGFHLTT